ncbi:MAG: hypothetical protein EXX96DRAFT_564187 [Benjaminiella poitrasii]|nr:MAG: hypothetical protein EXX96DRAFT_564187 [Benjaminiella poitrasii]
MLFSKVILSILALTGACSASDRFIIRHPTSSRTLGFKYDKEPFFGGKCKETYDKYLKVQSGSDKGVHFKLTNCNDDGFCHLFITDGDYKGYCLSGHDRPESQSCTGYDNKIFKLNLDFSISTTGGKYLGVGDEYTDDCGDFEYTKLGDEKYHWLIDYDSDKDLDYDVEDEADFEEYYYHPRGGQRIFHHCRD